MARPKKSTKPLSANLTYTELTPLAEGIPIHIKIKGDLTEELNKELETKIFEPLIAEGYLYFILDLLECTSITDHLLKTIILQNWPLNPYMGRIITILDPTKPNNQQANALFKQCNFYGEPPVKPIFAFFDSVDKALNWIPKDRARRTKLREEEAETSVTKASS